MIELNLLPKELRKKRKRQMPDIKPVPIAAGVAAVLVFTHIVLVLMAANDNNLLKELKAKWEQMAPQREMTEKIARETNELEKRVTAVRMLAKPALDWARLMSGLNQAMIPSVWLADLRVFFNGRPYNLGAKDQKPTTLVLAGYALGRSEEATSTAARFINSLKGAGDFYGYFDEIELKNLKKVTVSGSEAMLFNLVCEFSKPKKPGKK